MVWDFLRVFHCLWLWRFVRLGWHGWRPSPPLVDVSPPRHLRCLRCLHRCYCPGFLLLPSDWNPLFAWLVFVQRIEGHAGRKEEGQGEESEEMIWSYLTCSVAHTASSPKCLNHLSCFVCPDYTCKDWPKECDLSFYFLWYLPVDWNIWSLTVFPH